MAPKIAEIGEFTFVIHTEEDDREAPHVHVSCGGAEFRINLRDGAFLEPPPSGKARKASQAYDLVKQDCVAAWRRYHAKKVL